VDSILRKEETYLF